MRINKFKRLGRLLTGLISIFAVAILLTGCPSGGGGGGGTLPPDNQPAVHTEFTTNAAYVSQAGQSYNASVTVYETRGDEINFSKMYTYRTFADYSNSGKTSNYYNGSPALIRGWMFDVPAAMTGNIRDAIIDDSTSDPNRLKGHERRTISTTVMIGKEFEEKPYTFDGMFIPWDTYRQWALNGHQGVRYWVTLEGYDYTLNDNYNIHIPIEIQFPSNLSSDGSYPVNPGDSDTNPYDPGI
ncbi:MAG: hypothetical protein ACQETH_08505 [Candidatus Rifleibacteriota bacterium]